MAEESLRERKKGMIRRDIILTAERLFEAKGYDQVTVAEIADAANISVKTLFTYFRSKEDLLFQDSSLIDNILADLNSMHNASPAQTVANTLIHLMAQKEASADGLSSFQKSGYGQSDSLRSGLLRLWADYEEAITKQLTSADNLMSDSYDARFLASQLVTLIRATTWNETESTATNATTIVQNSILTKWLKEKASLIDKLYGFCLLNTKQS